MIPAAKRKTPFRKRKTSKKTVAKRQMHFTKGDKNFQEGWGFNDEFGRTAHYFKPSVAGMRVTLCHRFTQAPLYILPVTDDAPHCTACRRLLERREHVTKTLAERQLRKKLDARVASFMADPALGPRLYACPTCNTVYEGFAPQLFPCSDGGHEPVSVVELARKDTWTRDKPT